MLGSCPTQSAISLATKFGFTQSMLKPGDLLVIPAGFLVCSVTMGKGSAFLRWCVSPTTDAAVKESSKASLAVLQDLLSAFPSLKSAQHKAWMQALEIATA